MFQVYASDDHLLILNGQIDAQVHRHLFIHLIICLEDDPIQTLSLSVQQQTIVCRGAIIRGNTLHNFHGLNTKQALVLIDHTSRLGRGLVHHYLSKQGYVVLPEPLAFALAKLFRCMPDEVSTPFEYHLIWNQVLSELQLTHCAAKHNIDDKRLVKVLATLKAPNDFDFSIDDLATQVHLSSSRLSHLFKEYTGGTLKSYLLFKQLIGALSYVAEGSSVSDAALSSGFDTPSHLSSTCKRLMGIQPNIVNKVSGFLKVSLFH